MGVRVSPSAPEKQQADTERKRGPGIGKDSDPQAEWATVYGWMRPVPTAEDIRWKTYQGSFVHSWGEFEREWEGFYNSHQEWHEPMWHAFTSPADFANRARSFPRGRQAGLQNVRPQHILARAGHRQPGVEQHVLGGILLPTQRVAVE